MEWSSNERDETAGSAKEWSGKDWTGDGEATRGYDKQRRRVDGYVLRRRGADRPGQAKAKN